MPQQRRFTSYALFVLAVIAFIILAPVAGNFALGVLVAILAILAGVIFYRRGR